MRAVSVVIPAYNEEAVLARVVADIRTVLSPNFQHEIVVVVDGSTDRTEAIARDVADQVLVHPINLGYGRSLKSGISAARHDWIVITDADGTYPIDRIPDLLAHGNRFHMVVGARSGKFYRGGLIKQVGRTAFRWLSEFATGQSIPDINSGLRAFRKQDITPYFPLINSGFSFTTTSTLVYLLNGRCIQYIPIDYYRRAGKSKVRHIRDSLRALQIIVEAILRCNPIKAFLLLAIPTGSCGLIVFVLAAIFRSSGLWIGAAMFICTAILLIGLGFVAVSALPPRANDLSFPMDELDDTIKEDTHNEGET